MEPRKPGGQPGNQNAASGQVNDGRLDLRLPREMIAAMRAATHLTGDRGLNAFTRRLIQQELDRLKGLPK